MTSEQSTRQRNVLRQRTIVSQRNSDVPATETTKQLQAMLKASSNTKPRTKGLKLTENTKRHTQNAIKCNDEKTCSEGKGRFLFKLARRGGFQTNQISSLRAAPLQTMQDLVSSKNRRSLKPDTLTQINIEKRRAKHEQGKNMTKELKNLCNNVHPELSATWIDEVQNSKRLKASNGDHSTLDDDLSLVSPKLSPNKFTSSSRAVCSEDRSLRVSNVRKHSYETMIAPSRVLKYKAVTCKRSTIFGTTAINSLCPKVPVDFKSFGSTLLSPPSSPAKESRPQKQVSEVHTIIPVNESIRVDTDTGKINEVKPVSKVKSVNNDNFVALDLKNAAGSCRGARKKGKNKYRTSRYKEYRHKSFDREDNNAAEEPGQPKVGISRKRSLRVVVNAGMDPLDDYFDGVLKGDSVKQGKNTENKSHPKVCCVRHCRPCKLVAVKKSGPNKGRKFYVCSLPRGEQCDHFAWKEDTLDEAQKALFRSSSSDFVARRVKAYADNKFKNLTVPELREETKKRGLKSTGKKVELLTRLLVWVRDEIAAKNVINHALPMSAEFKSLEDVHLCKKSDFTEIEDEDLEVEESDNDGLELIRKESIESRTETSTQEISLHCVLNNHENEARDLCKEVDGNSFECDSNDEPIPPESDVRDRMIQLQTALRKYFNHTYFRPGQLWAIQRTLDNKSSLLVAPTGMGKTLCYALPAVLMEGLTIVVSPLLSLIQDQLQNLPPSIPATTLSGNLSMTAIATIIDDVLQGRIKILFVSPERLSSAAFRHRVIPRLRSRVALFCVDESHCVSQWGHNFRTSYLRLRSIIPLLQPRSVLAVTATAGPKVINDICSVLAIPKSFESESTMVLSDNEIPENGILVMDSNRGNITVVAEVFTGEEIRRNKLFGMLKSSDDTKKCPIPLGSKEKSKRLPDYCLYRGSVIIYVWRKRDAEALAEQLRAVPAIKGGVVFYHGGMDSAQRQRAQTMFMRGKARICVATVAFGLGIDKPDIFAVVHMCLPQSLEHYLQEIGRAGRDGSDAFAFALLLSEEATVRHSLAHADGITRNQVRYILDRLGKLVDCAINDYHITDKGIPNAIDVTLKISEIIEAVDVKHETIETILSALEGSRLGSFLTFEGTICDEAIITLKKGDISRLAAVEPIARAIQASGKNVKADDLPQNEHASAYGGTALEKGFHAYSHGSWSFSVVRCASFLGEYASPRHVFAALRRLQNAGEFELMLDSSKTGKAFHLKLNTNGVAALTARRQSYNDDNPKDLTINDLVDCIIENATSQERTSANKVEEVYSILYKVALAWSCSAKGGRENIDISSQVLFQSLVSSYMQDKKIDIDERYEVCSIHQNLNDHDSKKLWIDFCTLLRDPSLSQERVSEGLRLATSTHEEIEFTVRCIVKILHGLESPRISLKNGWGRYILWGKWRDYRFADLHAVLTKKLSKE